MYSSRVPRSLLLVPPNLAEGRSARHLLARKLSLGAEGVQRFRERCRSLFREGALLEALRELPRSLGGSAPLLRAWGQAWRQRLRRGQRMAQLCSKLCEEGRFRGFVEQLRRQVFRKENELLYGLVGLVAFNWDSARIHDKDLDHCSGELQYVERLKAETIYCKDCKKRKVIDVRFPNVDYCTCCKGGKDCLASLDGWEPYTERADFIVWKRLKDAGQYEYKVCGSYNDVTAADFLSVQLDIDYRKVWDKSAVQLMLVERDPEESSTAEILYWEFVWPRAFSNRDYVFQRRYSVQTPTDDMIVVNKAVEHPSCPEYPKKHRVKNYWSCMVIQPVQHSSQPGINFSLTYFDNPGINIPSYITSWVVTKEMPNYLAKLRKAARNYKDYCKSNGRKAFELKYSNNSKGGKAPQADQTKADGVRTLSSTTADILMTSPMVEAEQETGGFWNYFQVHRFFT